MVELCRKILLLCKFPLSKLNFIISCFFGNISLSFIFDILILELSKFLKFLSIVENSLDLLVISVLFLNVFLLFNNNLFLIAFIFFKSLLI